MVEIQNIEKSKDKVTVYNFEEQGEPHDYFAQDYLVHNIVKW